MFKQLVSTLVFLLLLSCGDDKIIDKGSVLENGKEVNLSINVPRTGASTYAEAATIDENHIDTLFVKIFENNVLKDTKKFFGSALQQGGAIVNDSVVNVSFEMADLTGGAVTVDVFANRMDVMTITDELPLPDVTNPQTLFMMSGSGALTYNGTSYNGTIHVVRNVAKLRVKVSKNVVCIPSDLIIDYEDIVVEIQQVPDRVQLMPPLPISTPSGLTYIDYSPRTGSALRPQIPFASFTGGQIDSLYLYENFLNNSSYTAANTTRVKMTLVSHAPGMPKVSSDYTFPLFSEGSHQIKRNYIYTLDIKVSGQSLEPFVTLDIQPWEDINIEGSILGSLLSLDESVINLEPVSAGSAAGAAGYKTDNQAIYFDWSKIKPEHNIDTNTTHLQGTEGNIEIFWNNNGAPDFDFTDTMYVTAGNIVKAVFLDYKAPKGTSGNWVGTFHRWNQRGERIIKIPNKGAWLATVTTGASFIALDSTITNDANWGTLSAALGNDTNFETDHPVNSTATTVSGVGVIYFRVGMKSILASAESTPRYGLIEITTSEGVKKIYVRQGEEPDYVMRPEDLNPSTSSSRSSAARFSPFNLKDPSNGIGGNNITLHNNMPYNESLFNSSKFTDYPSQAGYLFQWNLGGGTAHKAFNPVNPINVITGWENTVKAQWDTSFDPCPSGYRHTTDLQQSAANSEIRQSWYATPDNSTHASPPSSGGPANSVWGFYADGFFDRRAIVASPNGTDSTTVSYTSSTPGATENTKIAYAGHLIYNPTTYASIFLPAAGERININGILINSGALGAYWTGTYNGNNGWAYYFTPSSSYIYSSAHQSSGLSVRCVKSYYGLPGSI